MQQVIWEWPGKKFRLMLDAIVDLAIPQTFSPRQPQHFGAPLASVQPWRTADFVGDLQAGGSCQVHQVQLIPHCNGTHTETVRHVSQQGPTLDQVVCAGWIPAVLVSVPVRCPTELAETYALPWDPADEFIGCDDLRQAVERIVSSAGLPATIFNSSDQGKDAEPWALIVRTVPNDQHKLQRDYSCSPAPFFSAEATAWVAATGFQHWLVDVPSLDRAHDQGMMANHCCFWSLRIHDRHPLDHDETAQMSIQRTITEMIFVKDSVEDGLYGLNLQFPAWKTDAAPSRPLVAKLVPVPDNS